ncbi:MAG: hypothetical protein JJ858_17295 [Rhizobiaceae bacterium]|nr:hypothetical protein [Rhizobiaceae bacterium]
MTRSTERFAILIIICFLLFSAAMDIADDLKNGDTFGLIILDLIAVTALISLLAYIYVLQPLKTRSENRQLIRQTNTQSDDLERLSLLARKQLEGLGQYIKVQFDNWGLTSAEQDVALLLLKGFSMREISQIRDVSERTIRQQATVIYGKSELSGRAALSAYFLEDLLLPTNVGETRIPQNKDN